MATTKLSMRLLVDIKAHKVLLAEARKDIVDFLFNLLALPLGTIVKLLEKQSMKGCLGNIYDSVKCLDEIYIESNRSKEPLLDPKPATYVAQVPFLLPKGNTAPAEGAVNYYICNCDCSYVTDTCGIACPSCGEPMSTQKSYVRSQAEVESTGDGGYVKGGVVTYMVMDDLSVTPMSTISCIALLNRFNVKELGSLEEKIVDLGIKESLELVKASFQSRTVLTDVFLEKI